MTLGGTQVIGQHGNVVSAREGSRCESSGTIRDSTSMAPLVGSPTPMTTSPHPTPQFAKETTSPCPTPKLVQGMTSLRPIPVLVQETTSPCPTPKIVQEDDDWEFVEAEREWYAECSTQSVFSNMTKTRLAQWVSIGRAKQTCTIRRLPFILDPALYLNWVQSLGVEASALNHIDTLAMASCTNVPMSPQLLI